MYSELTLDEFRQLCYMAYRNYSKAAEFYCKKFKISTQEFRTTAQKLTSASVLELTSFVHPRHHLKILMCLSKHYPSWVKAFNTLSFTNTSTAEYLWNLAQKLVKDDFEGAAKLTRPYIGIGDKHFNLFRYIQEQAVSDARYMRLLNGNELQQMVDETLHELFANDELGDDYLVPLSEAIPADNGHHDEIMDEIAAFRYFLYGTASKPTGKPTIWSMAVKAMGLMYQGKLDDAFTQFTKAVKMVKKQKGAFTSPMFNYAFGILLYRLKSKYKDSETYQEWYGKFKQSSRIRFSSENTGLNILLTYIDNDIETVRSSILRQMNHLTDFHRDSLSRTWKHLVFNFFGLETGVLNKPLHSAKLLQHELSVYLPIGPLAKQQLQELYGGQPLLSTIRRKAPWEVLLSDIGDQMNQHQLGQAKRVAYYVDGKDLQAVVEQVQRADGTWREGQLLSLSQMANTGYDSMDSTDVAIAIRLEKGSPSQSAIDVLVPQSMTATLRDYQKEGFRWMCRLDAWGAGSCLADDMGLGKTLQALTFLTYKADKGPSLVIMPFTSYLEMIKPELKKREWDFLYLDGQTPMEKRQNMVDQFQKGQCRLFLSSLKAGGLGINLTAANYVILLDPWWNPAIENQAMDRTHRLGQKRVVTVIRLVSSQTIEEKILTLHEKKQDLSDSILDGTGESYKLSYEDILDMVAPF